MIESFYIKIYFVIVIISFLIGMIAPIILIRKKGMDPHGTHGDASILTRLSAVTIMLWIAFIILYLFMDEIIGNFWIIDFLAADVFIIIGMILIGLGFIFEILGIIALGENFRIELPVEETKLITTGIYRLMRNPIVFGIFLLMIGSFFTIPTIINLIIGIMNIITFNSKAIDEEKFLSKRFGNKFEEYKNKVGRYLPFSIKNK
ncbi:MAG: methyltransferase family protein [Promethearchaeota archaeon]